MKVFHCCCDLPPLMKRNQMCHRHRRTRMLQNLAQLQRIESLAIAVQWKTGCLLQSGLLIFHLICDHYHVIVFVGCV
jgi:hypothetical protein